MKIGIIDADNHNFPNLALMKISNYYKTKGDDVEFVSYYNHYDRVYISKVFSWTKCPADNYNINSDEIIKGGTGYDLKNKLPEEIENMSPDYYLYPDNKYAVGFLTRGCSRRCPFCIVNEKEGASHKVADLDSFWTGQKLIKLLDPNLLEYKGHIKLLKELYESKAKINFTQGLDIRLINSESTELIKKMKTERIHFAYDRPIFANEIEKKLIKFKEDTGYNRKVSVYVLTNYETTLQEDIKRVDFIKSLGFSPYVMIYEKYKLPKNSIRKHVQRWSNLPRFFRNMSFQDYCAIHKLDKGRLIEN